MACGLSHHLLKILILTSYCCIFSSFGLQVICDFVAISVHVDLQKGTTVLHLHDAKNVLLTHCGIMCYRKKYSLLVYFGFTMM